MKSAHNLHLSVWFTIMGLALASCSNPQLEAVTLLKAAEQLADTLPTVLCATKIVELLFLTD